MAKTTKLAALIDQYYKTLDEFAFQYDLHEGAVSVAFQTLLAETARGHNWTLIPQLTDKKVGKSIRPEDYPLGNIIFEEPLFRFLPQIELLKCKPESGTLIFCSVAAFRFVPSDLCRRCFTIGDGLKS